MSAEAIEQGAIEWQQREYTVDSFKDFLAQQMNLTDGQKIAGVDAHYIENYFEGKLQSSGVRLMCSVLGSAENGGLRTWDIYSGEGMDDSAEYQMAVSLANTPRRQRFVTWVGQVGFEKIVNEPLPTLKINSTRYTQPSKGW